MIEPRISLEFDPDFLDSLNNSCIIFGADRIQMNIYMNILGYCHKAKFIVY